MKKIAEELHAAILKLHASADDHIKEHGPLEAYEETLLSALDKIDEAIAAIAKSKVVPEVEYRD